MGIFDFLKAAAVAPPGSPQSGPAPFMPSSIGPQGNPNAGGMGEIGVSGLHVFSGYVNEEYLPELFGWQARKIWRQMSEGDPICVAVLTAIALILRAVDWRIEPANDSSEAEKQAEFVQQCFDDMSQPFPDFIGEALSMLPFGWAYHEIVLKRRVGPDQTDPAKRSKFTDGRIGIRKLAIRSQDSLLRWEIQADGGINGMWQQPPQGGPLLLIPIERALLFRTTSKKNSPEGVSIFRAAYRPWYIKKTIEDHEAIGVERELAGLPIVCIPQKYMAANASSEEKATALRYQTVARDLKFNQQAGIVIPSDCYPNADGTLSANKLVEVKLLSTAGRRAIETSPIIDRYNRDIARSALADFIMLGDTKGSYALSKNKSELFLRACETFLNQIAEPINRYLIPRLFQYNGIDAKLMPEAKPGRVAPVDLTEIGTFIQQLAAAGAPLFPDEPLEDYLREIADLPEPSPEAHDAAMMGLAASSHMNNQSLQEKDENGNPIDDTSFGQDGPASSFFSAQTAAQANKGFVIKGAKDRRGGSQTSGRPFYAKAFDLGEARDPSTGEWTTGGGSAGGSSGGTKRTQGWSHPKIKVVKTWMAKASMKDGIKEIAGHLVTHATKKQNVEKAIAYAINTAINHATPPNLWGQDERDVIKGVVTDFAFTMKLTHEQAKDALIRVLDKLAGIHRDEMKKDDDDPIIAFIAALKAAIARYNTVGKAFDPSEARDDQGRWSGESDKSFAARVVDKRPSPNVLPEDHGQYFHMAGATVMPISQLVSSKTDAENAKGGENGAKRMAAAAAGELARRVPISVAPMSDGRYLVTDGNGTLTAAKRYGWQALPVKITGETAKYSPDQARDYHGRWAAEFGGPDIKHDMTTVNKEPPRQNATSLEALYAQAKTDQSEFEKTVTDVAAKTNGRAVIAPLKTKDSAERKMRDQLEGDHNRLLDVLRATVVYPTVAASREVASQFVGQNYQDIVRIKDRQESLSTDGYRDLMVNVRTSSGMIAELQFNSEHMTAAKSGIGHQIYEQMRNVNVTPQARNSLLSQSLNVYNSAFDADGDHKYKQQV